MADKYDEAIAYFRAIENEDDRNKEIYDNWNTASYSRFSYTAAMPGNPSILFMKTGSPKCGCLTQIKDGYSCGIHELEEAIRNDPRIPEDGTAIRMEHLEVFAEWQRRIDAAYEKMEAAPVNE